MLLMKRVAHNGNRSMQSVLRIISVLALLAFLFLALISCNLFWSFNFGDCKDGCGEGMAYILFLPAIVGAAISAIIAVGAHITVKRMRSKSE